MANQITDETIEYVGILAKLELTAMKRRKKQKKIWEKCWITLIH